MSVKGHEIKMRLMDGHKKQVWLLFELRKRGYPKLTTSRLSEILGGSYNGGCADEVLQACEIILKENNM